MFFTFWHLSFCFFRTRTRTTRLMWTSSLVKKRLRGVFRFPRRKIHRCRFIDWLQQDGHHEALSAGRDNEWMDWIGIVCNDALNGQKRSNSFIPKKRSRNQGLLSIFRCFPLFYMRTGTKTPFSILYVFGFTMNNQFWVSLHLVVTMTQIYLQSSIG